MRIYTYLRASTNEQDAMRANESLEQFVSERGLQISGRFIENESGATLKRPELFRLLEIAQSGDVLLVEQVDRLSRLNESDWQKLRSGISDRGIRIVAIDLPTSHMMMNIGDEFTSRMFNAVNGMMLDMLAAIARKDYEDRRRRQSEGIKKAVIDKKYKGRPANDKQHKLIMELRNAGKSYSEIQQMVGCARTTISRAIKSTGSR